MIKVKFFVPLIVIVFLVPGLLSAQDFDGKKPLLCSIIEVTECAPASGCIKGVAENFHFPQFVKIDFKKKIMTGLFRNEPQTTAPIEKVAIQDGMLILNGIQNGRAWNIVISQTNGHLTGTIAANDFTFTVFGASIPQ